MNDNIVCTMCGWEAIASWNFAGKKIATCFQHKDILTSIQSSTITKYYNYFNGYSSWNPYGYWYFSSGIDKK